jgi:hypothetical protein
MSNALSPIDEMSMIEKKSFVTMTPARQLRLGLYRPQLRQADLSAFLQVRVIAEARLHGRSRKYKRLWLYLYSLFSLVSIDIVPNQFPKV